MEHPPRLFLGNILWNTTQNQIQQVLDKYKVGQGVQHIHIPRKGNFIHGIQHTIAFVTYEEKDQVEEAVTLLHDRILEGVSTYPVSAMHARSRHEGKQYPQFPKTAIQSRLATQDRGNQTVPVIQEAAHQGAPHQPQEQQPFVFPCTFQQGLGQPSQAFQQTNWAQQPSQPCQHGFPQPGHSPLRGLFQSGGHGCPPVHSAQQMHHEAAFEPMMAFGQHVLGHFGSHQVHHGTIPPWRNPPGATCKAKSVVFPKPKPTSRVPSVDENEQAAQENQWYCAQDQAKPDTTSETDPPTSPIEDKQKKQPSRGRIARPKKKLPQPRKPVKIEPPDEPDLMGLEEAKETRSSSCTSPANASEDPYQDLTLGKELLMAFKKVDPLPSPSGNEEEKKKGSKKPSGSTSSSSREKRRTRSRKRKDKGRRKDKSSQRRGKRRRGHERRRTRSSSTSSDWTTSAGRKRRRRR